SGTTELTGISSSPREEDTEGRRRFTARPQLMLSESRSVEHVCKPSRRILVGALRNDCLAQFEVPARVRRRTEPYAVTLARHQMHLDARFALVEARDVRESARIEVGVEHAVDDAQHVQVERGGHADRV